MKYIAKEWKNEGREEEEEEELQTKPQNDTQLISSVQERQQALGRENAGQIYDFQCKEVHFLSLSLFLFLFWQSNTVL